MPLGLRAAAFAATILIAWVAATTPTGQVGDRERLRGMPIERRRALAENLARFDALDRPEREALLALDARLAGLPAEERARSLELARRYHLWLRGLPEDRRRAIAEAPPARRIALIEQYREEERLAALEARPDDPIWTFSSTFNPTTFGEEALQARRWRELSSSQKDEVMARVNPAERVSLLMKLSDGRRSGRRDEYPHIAQELNATIRKFNEQARKANEEALKKPPGSKGNLRAVRPLWAAQDAASKARAIHAIEDRYFRAHEPPAVSPHELIHFESELPPWIRERISAFPPEAARWRLSVLHHLVHSTPAATPNKKPATPPTAPKPVADGSMTRLRPAAGRTPRGKASP